ncbi:MAG: TonB-dependent receptor [Candidatus Eisenbacteria bacterium]
MVSLTLMLGIVAAIAGTTGTLRGKVLDEKKTPQSGVNIRIEGQRLGALSDEQGNYIIIGIPAGTYRVIASRMDLAAYSADNVQITPDFTTDLNLNMKTQAIQVEEVRITAERPLLQRDATGTTRFLSAEDVQKLPTRGYRDAVAQQTGIVNFQRQIDNESSNSPTLITRGGRPNETAYFVDGFSQQDPLTGTSSTAINNNAIQEVVLLTGGFAPEYGRVMSGAVNVITREGSKKYSGGLEAVTDALAGDWVKAPRTDYNVYAAHVGGPVIPGRENLTFFASGERGWQRERSPSFIPDITADRLRALGLDTDFKPNDFSSTWIWQGKVSWQLNDKMSLKGGALASQDHWREYLHSYFLFNRDHMPRYEDKNQNYTATFNHLVSTKTFWNLGLNFFDTERTRGDGVAFDNLAAYYRASNPRFDPDLPMFWRNGHVFNNFLKRHSSYWALQGCWTSQIDDHNQIKAGGDYQRHTLRYLQHYFPTRLSGRPSGFNDIDSYGYTLRVTRPGVIDIVELDDDDEDGPKHPKIWSLYLQDKFEREGVIVNGGLRFDQINVDTPALVDPRAPLVEGEFSDSLDIQDLTNNKTYRKISPRLGVAFPLDDRTLLRFNYGQFYQQPNLQDLYVSYRFLEYKINSGGYFVGFGNPNLKPERTTAYEVGLQKQVGNRGRLDVTAYYKDVTDLVEVTNITPRVGVSSKSFTTYRNRDFATIKGVDVGYTLREVNHLSANMAYSLSFAQGTGSVSNSQGNIAWTASNPPTQTSPLDFDQRHKITLNLDLRYGRNEGPDAAGFSPLSDMGINILYNIASGTPYTPTSVYNELTQAAVSSQPSGPLNSRYGPWTQSMDLKATRGFGMRGLHMEGFVWVLNAFNAQNAYRVYTSSGSAETTGWLNTNEGRTYLESAAAAGKDGAGAYRLAENNPTIYGNPRLVRFGVRTTF